MAFGKMLYRDPTFWKGNNGTAVYNNSGNGMVTITREQDTAAPNDSKYVLKIQTKGTASPGNGGFYFGTTCSSRKVLVARIIAKIPAGRNICWATNSIGTGGSSRWLTPTAGTGRLEGVHLQGRLRDLEFLQHPLLLYRRGTGNGFHPADLVCGLCNGL